MELAFATPHPGPALMQKIEEVFNTHFAQIQNLTITHEDGVFDFNLGGTTVLKVTTQEDLSPKAVFITTQIHQNNSQFLSNMLHELDNQTID